MKKFFYKINNTPIFFRLSMIISVVFFLILGLFFISFNNYRKEKESSICNSVTQNNYLAISKIDDYINDINNITKMPLTYKQGDDIYMNYLYDFNATQTNPYPFQLLNEQIFEEIFTYKNSIDSCFIYNLQGNGDYKVKHSIYSPFNPIDESWFSDCIDSFGKPILIDTYELPNVVNEHLKPLYVFGIARGIVRIQDASVIGVLLVNTEVSYFEEICNNLKMTPNHRIVILHDDYTIYDTNTSNIATKAADFFEAIPENTANNMVSISIDGETILASSMKSASNDWRIVSLIPRSELFSNISHMQKRHTIMLACIMALSILLIFWVSRQIVTPIKRLCKIMKLAEAGDFNTHIQVTQSDEVGMLSISYNSLLEKINELIQEVYLQQIASNKLELQMLQSQINPHFLYNTLESISMMATINDDDTTSDMATNLGSILRYSISNINQLVTLGDEISQLRKYIALQECRFGSQYHITIDIEPNYYSIIMPKLILQPIVENAIYHGMSTIRSNGKIVITAEKPDANTLLLIVSDNGIGMTEQKLQDLNDYIQEKNNLFKSIGMRNVNRRIQLFCGSEYGLKVESTLNTGTTVYVRIQTNK